MTRAEKVAEARRLRDEGLLLKQIAQKMGVATATVGDYLNDPDRARLKARKARLGQPCVDCGARTSRGSESRHVSEPRCERCGREERVFYVRDAREARRREIERRWLAGESLRQIATTLNSTHHSIAATIAEMRAEGGYNVPHRKPTVAAWHHAHPETIAHARAVQAEQRMFAEPNEERHTAEGDGMKLTRSAPLLRRSPLRSRPKRRKPSMAEQEARLAWKTPESGPCGCGCGRFSMHLERHHVLYRQHVRAEGGDEWCLANSLLLHPDCHRRHHDRIRAIRIERLPESALAFAVDLLGEGRATLYFHARYDCSVAS